MERERQPYLKRCVFVCTAARSLGNRVSRSAYHEYLASMIHHNQATLLQPEQASVALEFEHMSTAEKKIATVLSDNGKLAKAPENRLKESLIIHKNNELLSDFEAEHWQDLSE